MKDLTDILSPRQIYILQNHGAKTYATLAAELGISSERVRQIKVEAERAIRAEKQREQQEEQNKITLLLPMTRWDTFLLLRALDQYYIDLLRVNRRRKIPDPDLNRCVALIEEIRKWM